jgi:hypothetical protein
MGSVPERPPVVYVWWPEEILVFERDLVCGRSPLVVVSNTNKMRKPTLQARWTLSILL